MNVVVFARLVHMDMNIHHIQAYQIIQNIDVSNMRNAKSLSEGVDE